MTQPIERHTIYYSGHVQGVGFRYTTQTIARRHAVAGYVRNLPDGRVELVVEGSVADVGPFLREVRDHFANQIRSEQADIQAATREFSTFEIRR